MADRNRTTLNGNHMPALGPTVPPAQTTAPQNSTTPSMPSAPTSNDTRTQVQAPAGPGAEQPPSYTYSQSLLANARNRSTTSLHSTHSGQQSLHSAPSLSSLRSYQTGNSGYNTQGNWDKREGPIQLPPLPSSLPPSSLPPVLPLPNIQPLSLEDRPLPFRDRELPPLGGAAKDTYKGRAMERDERDSLSLHQIESRESLPRPPSQQNQNSMQDTSRFYAHGSGSQGSLGRNANANRNGSANSLGGNTTASQPQQSTPTPLQTPTPTWPSSNPFVSYYQSPQPPAVPQQQQQQQQSQYGNGSAMDIDTPSGQRHQRWDASGGMGIDDPDVRMAAEALGDLRAGTFFSKSLFSDYQPHLDPDVLGPRRLLSSAHTKHATHQCQHFTNKP